MCFSNAEPLKLAFRVRKMPSTIHCCSLLALTRQKFSKKTKSGAINMWGTRYQLISVKQTYPNTEQQEEK